MTLNYELDYDWIKMNHLAEYVGQRSLLSNVIVRSTQTHKRQTDRTTRTTKVIGNNCFVFDLIPTYAV